MRILRVTALVVAMAAVACGGGSKSTTGGETTPTGGGEQKSLYDRLGGQGAITAVVDAFLTNVLADAAIKDRFANADAAHLRQMLIDQICNASGGPCEYKGKNMIEAHTGMGVTEDEFNALVGDLVKALDGAGVGETEKNELLTALGGMKGEIVGK
jgi:hemoglobin